MDIQTVHEWLDAGGDPDELILWVEMWKDENLYIQDEHQPDDSDDDLPDLTIPF